LSLKIGDWAWLRGNSRPSVVEEVDGDLVHVLTILGDGVAVTAFSMSAPPEHFRKLDGPEANYWRTKICAILSNAGVTLPPERAKLFLTARCA